MGQRNKLSQNEKEINIMIIRQRPLKTLYIIAGEILITGLATVCLIKTGSQHPAAWAFPFILGIAALIQTVQFLGNLILRQDIELTDESVNIIHRLPAFTIKIPFPELGWSRIGSPIGNENSLTMPLDTLNYGLILKHKNNASIEINLNEGNFDVPLLVDELKRKNVPLPVCFIQIDRFMKTLHVLDIYRPGFTIGNIKDRKNPDYFLDDHKIEEKILVKIDILPDRMLVKNLCRESTLELAGTIRSKKLGYGEQDTAEDGLLFIGKTWISITRFGY